MAINFSLPSQNQLLQAGLGVMGAGFNRNINPFLAASQGIAQGRQQDLLEKQEERQAAADARAQAAFDMQQRQQAAWRALFDRGLPRAGDLARTPGIAPQPGEGAPIDLLPPSMGGSAGDQLAMATPNAPMVPSPQAGAGNPMLAGLPQGSAPLLAAMGPQAGGRFLLEQMIKGPPQRRIVDGADGYKYYADTGERVLPGVEARDPDLLSPEALSQQALLRQAGRSSTNVTNVLGGEDLTPGQEAVDKAFAETYNEFVLGGGYGDAERNIQAIGGVLERLRQPSEIGGTFAARFLPEGARAIVDQEGLDVQQTVEQVVQRDLRAVLGGQFSEREGENLIRRAYNPALPDEVNERRLEALYDAMQKGYEAKVQASNWFRENGTLRGYQGSYGVTMDQLNRALDNAAASEKGGASKFDGLSADELLNFDVNAIETEEDVRQYEEALRAAGAL